MACGSSSVTQRQTPLESIALSSSASQMIWLWHFCSHTSRFGSPTTHSGRTLQRVSRNKHYDHILLRKIGIKVLVQDACIGFQVTFTGLKLLTAYALNSCTIAADILGQLPMTK
jgi:hypothetical protein